MDDVFSTTQNSGIMQLAGHRHTARKQTFLQQIMKTDFSYYGYNIKINIIIYNYAGKKCPKTIHDIQSQRWTVSNHSY